jgi:hypothetical protein
MRTKPLSLAEKCALVSTFGDIPTPARKRLSDFAMFEASSGILIGSLLVGQFDDGKFAIHVRPSLLDN